jgi:hypothetical protein
MPERAERKGHAMDIDRERIDLQHQAANHQQRVNELELKIDRSSRELRLHVLIRDLAANSLLPEAMRGLAERASGESTEPGQMRDFLVRRGVDVPEEFDIGTEGAGEDFSAIATYRDDWFDAELSWSWQNGFQGRVTDNSRRDVQVTTATEGV